MRRQLRIMVLDSSETSRKILEVILRRTGHLVVSFGDPVEALRFLSRRRPADLLFLSTELPRIDGFDVLKYLKSEPRLRSTVPVALLDEGVGVLGRIKVRLVGAQHVVTKPLLRQQIIALVSSHLLSKDGVSEECRPTDVASQWSAGRWDEPREGER
jgi:CheY-like chemotaxis protein